MKQFTIFLLLLLFGVCSAGTALAAEAELQILVIGNGFVRGEGIGCSYSCTKSFEKGTVVHLKAIPFPNARFVEWKVDGQSHAGVITIEKDTVVSALFERKTEAPEDELQLTWYNGNSPEHGTIALDEMAVFLEEREKWGVTSEEAYQAAIQEILQTFHPQAELSQIKSKNMLFLKSPEPLSKTQWFETLYSLSDLKYVKYAGPVLYKIPGASWTQIILFDKISVDFPVSYTEEHIRAIEQEHELIRIKSSVLPNSFTYYAGSPLETVEKANRLYKSGVVEYAIPVTSIRMEPTSNIPDDEYFAQQWHLNNTMPAYTGEDINVLPVWEKKIYGTGKNIAIVDDGVEFAHPDLAQNRKPDKVNDPTDPNDDENYHHDFIDEDDDPIDNNPEDMIASDCVSAVHGTAVAGVAAARGFNDIGVSGVAPFANLIGYRTTVGSSGCGYTMGSDGWESVFPWGIQTVDIYNNSWEPQKYVKK